MRACRGLFVSDANRRDAIPRRFAEFRRGLSPGAEKTVRFTVRTLSSRLRPSIAFLNGP